MPIKGCRGCSWFVEPKARIDTDSTDGDGPPYVACRYLQLTLTIFNLPTAEAYILISSRPFTTYNNINTNVCYITSTSFTKYSDRTRTNQQLSRTVTITLIENENRSRNSTPKHARQKAKKSNLYPHNRPESSTPEPLATQLQQKGEPLHTRP